MSAYEVLHSGIWQLSSTVLGDAGAALVIDPGYFPRELSALAEVARVRGEVEGVIFTHGHWDHVIGWTSFPGAAVYGSPSLSRAVSEDGPLAQHNLRDAQEFDGRWYIDRGRPLGWPPAIRSLGEGATLPLGNATLRALLLPGHSPDGLALLLEDRGLLLCGDYLSPCEIPFVEDLLSYRQTLLRLQDLLRHAVAEVIPGHGPVLGRAQAQAIAAADLAYLDGLLGCADHGDEAAALGLPLPRAAAVPGMAEHHRDNWHKALAAVRGR